MSMCDVKIAVVVLSIAMILFNTTRSIHAVFPFPPSSVVVRRPTCVRVRGVSPPPHLLPQVHHLSPGSPHHQLLRGQAPEVLLHCSPPETSSPAAALLLRGAEGGVCVPPVWNHHGYKIKGAYREGRGGGGGGGKVI